MLTVFQTGIYKWKLQLSLWLLLQISNRENNSSHNEEWFEIFSFHQNEDWGDPELVEFRVFKMSSFLSASFCLLSFKSPIVGYLLGQVYNFISVNILMKWGFKNEL